MTPREQVAFNAGIEAMRQMAMIAAVTIKARDNAREIRHQAAAAALHGLAEGARTLLPSKPDPIALSFRMIANEPGSGGIIKCPACAGRLAWSRDPYNGHVHGQCETTTCLNWMQ